MFRILFQILVHIKFVFFLISKSCSGNAPAKICEVTMPKTICDCVNGGRCVEIRGILACECLKGFEGRRCEQLYSGFVRDAKNENIELFAIVTIVLLVFVAASVFCFFTWRKMKSKRKARIEMRLLMNRRQSRATIEGVSFSGVEWINSTQVCESCPVVLQPVISCEDVYSDSVSKIRT